MAMLQPKLAILDEQIPGLISMRIRIVANGVNKLHTKENGVLVVTHYQRLLDFIIPDFVHVLYNGRIVKSGTKELAPGAGRKGYDFIKNEVDIERYRMLLINRYCMNVLEYYKERFDQLQSAKMEKRFVGLPAGCI